MKLLSFNVLNYKSAKSVDVQISANEINTFIGINDSGKSSLLKAVGLFFDEKASVSFESDSTKRSLLSNSPLTTDEFHSVFESASLPAFDPYNSDVIAVICTFEVEEDWSFKELDEHGISIHLQHVLNNYKAGDKLVLMRTFSTDPSKAGYFIVCEDTEEPMSLWEASQAFIKAKQNEIGIRDADIDNQNHAGPLKNIERLNAIYAHLDTVKRWAKFDFKKDRTFFPAFRHLDWNISSDELNALTADVISPVVSELIKPIQKSVNDGRDEINTRANAELKTIYKKYAGSLPSSISGINANVNLNLQQAVTELFVDKITSDKKIHIDDQGDGIKRQIGLGLIKAIAQESLDADDLRKKYIWCLDEPETHLFPQAQRDLLLSLISMAKTHFEILISTHSTMFVDKSNISNIKQVSLDSYYTTLKVTSNTDDIFSNLGVRNSDFLFYDRFIAVEGSTEYYLFDRMYSLLYDGKSLSDDGIQLINLDGEANSVNQERLMKQIFKDFKKSEDMTVYMIDKDTGKSGTNIKLIGDKYDFEECIGDDIWSKAIKDYCKLNITKATVASLRAQIDERHKLYSLLSSYVANNKTDESEYLPSKGESLSKVLISYINDISHIHPTIVEGFEHARRGIKP